MSLILGMDTGGTYTDGVLFDKENRKIIAKTKALTTKEDFCICIGNCLNALPEEKLAEVGLVCLSTTMATNAVVEGKGCRTFLILMGKMPHGKLPAADVRMVKGALDIQGKVLSDVDMNEIDKVLEELPSDVESIVISGYASVRNPDHEIRIREHILRKTDLPVVCAHELSGALGFYERTVTAVLNGQLVPILKRLIWDTKEMLKERGISAPVMIVKGDGTFISAEMARTRPIDTLLSGPAASVTGAMFLSEADNAVFMDMGGTTTDIACLDNGKVKVSADGACIAGWRTRVRAIDMYTTGLGGDSLITLDEAGNVKIGPEKVTPLCLAAVNMEEFKGTDSGFTPTDLAHVKGIYTKWDSSASAEWISQQAARFCLTEKEMCERLEKSFISGVYNALMESGQYADGDIIIGIGAPARAWMPRVAECTGLDIRVPEHAEVANAVGAAAGNIEESAEITIRRDTVTGKYIGYLPCKRMEFDSLDDARKICIEEGRQWLEEQTVKCGCCTPDIIEEVEDLYCDRYRSEEKVYVETKMRLIAVGAPAFAECGSKDSNEKSSDNIKG